MSTFCDSFQFTSSGQYLIILRSELQRELKRWHLTMNRMTLITLVNVYSFIILISLCIFSFIHRRTNTLLKSILKCVQDYRGVPRKPAVLPLSSVEEMDELENADENCYTDVVSEKNNKIDLCFSSLSTFLSLSLSLFFSVCHCENYVLTYVFNLCFR